MLETITFNADQTLVAKSKAKAHAGNLELGDIMRALLEDYARDARLVEGEGTHTIEKYRVTPAAIERQPGSRANEEEPSREDLVARYRETMAKVKGKLVVGRKLTREEMNER